MQLLVDFVGDTLFIQIFLNSFGVGYFENIRGNFLALHFFQNASNGTIVFRFHSGFDVDELHTVILYRDSLMYSKVFIFRKYANASKRIHGMR